MCSGNSFMVHGQFVTGMGEMKSEVVLFESLRGVSPGGIHRRGCGVIANWRFVRMGTDSYGDGLFKIKPIFEFF